MITNVYSTIIELSKVAYHWKTGQKPTFMPATCPKRKFDSPNEWDLNIINKALTQI
jgi:hypothetical protein